MKRTLQDLLSDLDLCPSEFDESGAGYELLQHFLRGAPINLLRSFIDHRSEHARRTAAFVASELGSKAGEIAVEMRPLLRDSDAHTRWYAIEVMMLASSTTQPELFSEVLRAIDSDIAALRVLAMNLVERASDHQLRYSMKDATVEEIHRAGAELLLLGTPEDVGDFLRSHDPLHVRYGTIAAIRLQRAAERLLEIACTVEDAFAAEYVGKRSAQRKS